jgi:hypothetical protein
MSISASGLLRLYLYQHEIVLGMQGERMVRMDKRFGLNCGVVFIEAAVVQRFNASKATALLKWNPSDTNILYG